MAAASPHLWLQPPPTHGCSLRPRMAAGVRHARLHGAGDAGRRAGVRGDGGRVVCGRARVHAPLGQPPLPRPVAVRHRGAHQGGPPPFGPAGRGAPRGERRGARLCEGAARAAWRTALGQGGARPPVAPPAAQQRRRAPPRRRGARKGQGARRDRCSSTVKQASTQVAAALRRPTRPPSATSLWGPERGALAAWGCRRGDCHVSCAPAPSPRCRGHCL